MLSSRFSSSFLKSNLQKSVRLSYAKSAVRTAVELCRQSVPDFLRRLPIVIMEVTAGALRRTDPSADGLSIRSINRVSNNRAGRAASPRPAVCGVADDGMLPRLQAVAGAFEPNLEDRTSPLCRFKRRPSATLEHADCWAQ
jgi:hypothetical protein